MNFFNLPQHDIFVAFGISLVLALLLSWLRPSERGAMPPFYVVIILCGFAGLLPIAISAEKAQTVVAIIADGARIVLGLVSIRLASRILMRVVLPRIGISSARIAEDLLVTALFVAWVLAWLRIKGLDYTSLVTTSALITAVVAFSIQNTLGDILGGVALELDNSIQVGDWVRIGDVSGQVVEIRWRYTAIETRNRETVIFPNSLLMKTSFTVIGSRNDAQMRWRRWVWFNVELGGATTDVCEVLEKAVLEGNLANVATDPHPSAVLMEVVQGMGRYALRYWLIDPRDDDSTDSRVRAHVLAALERHGAKLGIPREERLVIHDDEARRAAIRSEELASRRNAINGVDLFADLSESERDSIAERLVYAPFVKGDIITRQGAVAHWLYIIIRGEADVWVQVGDTRHLLTTLTQGNVFGEMGMMTGEPRRASLIAKTNIECYRLDKEGFRHILTARPDVATKLSQVLASRVAELEQHRSTVFRDEKAAPGNDDILRRIRSFFGLNA
ncbi:MAG: mechanosensitive ion channel family protein [Gammaproteobacteria bacterium]